MRERVEAEGRRRAREDCREDAGDSFSICPYQQDTAAAAAWWRGYWAEVERVACERVAAWEALENCREDVGAFFSMLCPYRRETAAAAAWWRGYWAEVGRVVRERAAAQDRWRP